MPDFDNLWKTSSRTGTFHGGTQAEEDAYYAFFADEPLPASSCPRLRWLDSFADLLRRWAT